MSKKKKRLRKLAGGGEERERERERARERERDREREREREKRREEKRREEKREREQFYQGLTNSHTMTSFDVSGKEAFLKTLWEEEKMLVTSIFSFSHNVFYSIKDRNYHLCYIYSVFCKCFQFGQGQFFIVWEWVNSLGMLKDCKERS